MRRIRQVVGFGPELQVESLGNWECPEHTGVQVEGGRRTQDIASRGTEADGTDGGKGIRIVVRMAGPDAAQVRYRRQNLVRSLRVVGSIERGAGGSDREGQAGVCAKRTVHLPPT